MSDNAEKKVSRCKYAKKESDWGECFGNHHPYCKYTYEQIPKSAAGRLKISWYCICNVLKHYDKWRTSDEQR